MFSWLMNPLMLGLGTLAIASPIIIHLLNKRRFKIVEWAAMDFLFEADKKNRRRVQVENFILLFLRCLAMLLIGLLLARPFLPNEVARIIQPDQKYERIVLLDDSLSSQVLNENEPALQAAKDSLQRLLTELADANATEDWLTLTLTSEPEQPLLANEPVTKETLPTLLETIDQIESTDGRADYTFALGEFRRNFSAEDKNITRVAYVFTDLREADWLVSESTPADSTPNNLLNQLALDASECYLIDTAGANDQNIAITSLRPLDLQVSNRVIRFAAEVTNFGQSTIVQVRIVFQVNDAPPRYQFVANLQPNQTQEIVFPYLFATESETTNLTFADEETTDVFRNFQITAEVDRHSMTAEELETDQLAADSSAYCAAQIFDGIPVLLVDGDPSSVSERSETHYLNSLNVLGTGLKTTQVTATELENVSLSKYQVIFLCNVDEVSPDRIQSLKSWTQDGGSLVFMPGNKIRAERFNESFFSNGSGLSPLKLVSMAGDPTMSNWVNFEVDAQVHPSLRIVVESDQTSLSRVDIFSWWTSEYNESNLGSTFVVPLRLSDDRHSAAMAERSWGKGRVVVFTIPGDGDWSMWPSSPTYAPVMIDLIDYLVGSIGNTSNIRVGGSISWPVDLSAFDSRVYLKDPDGARVESVARPIGVGVDGQDDVLCRVQFDEISRKGFYEIGLKRHSGQTQQALFASNIDPFEGQLRRLSPTTMEGDFFSEKVKRLSVADVKNEKVSSGNTEIWPQLVWLLLIVLATEQFLGWWFGKRR